jgi:hypothetical protein
MDKLDIKASGVTAFPIYGGRNGTVMGS